MENNDLLIGITAAKAGRIQEAQAYLVRAVQNNPRSAESWLWLGHCLSEPKKREFCYQKVLALDPQNQSAQRALLALKSSPPAPLAQPLTVAPSRPPSIRASAVVQPSSAPLPKAPVKSKRVNQNLFLGLGLTVLLIGFLGIVGFLWFSGVLTTMAMQVAPASATVAPMASATPPPTPEQTPTPIPATATPTPNQTASARNNQVRADLSRAEALSYMQQGQYEQAITAWDKVISLIPDGDADYVQRSTCEYALTLLPISLENILHYLDLALADMDKAIALQPERIEYYGMRRQVLGRMGDMQDLTVNRLYLYERSLADLQVVIDRAPGQYSEADNDLVTLLIYSGHCEEGLAKIQEMLKQAAPEKKAQYYLLESVGYACLGKLDQALQAIDRSLSIGGTADALALHNEYLYQAGRSKEALDGINKFIELVPDYGGERYYLRALIYYEMDNATQVEQDLAVGKRLAYTNGQVLAYVQGKLALDRGDRENGIKYLQLAEASLDVIYNPLRWRIQKELVDLGAQPLTMTPTVLLTRTPTP